MGRVKSFRFLLAAVAALFLITACGLLRSQGPTAQPTDRLPTGIPPTTTAVPTSTPVSVASVAAATSPLPTVSVEVSPTATLTSTPQPFTATPIPTATPKPPTQTPKPTSTRVPPTYTPTPTYTPLPTVAITEWQGEYFANTSLQPPASVVRNDGVLDFTLARGATPAINVPTENWSARWTRTWTFEPGNYRFRLLVDDGARLWLGNRLLVDAWFDGTAREYAGERYLSGPVAIRLEYYNHLGAARVRLEWDRITLGSGWLGSYHDVADLSGLPVFQRADPAIQFDWGTGSPRWDLPVDNFSVRWSRTLSFAQAGVYRFRTVSDDGVRLWVDGNLVIDAWRDGVWTQEALVNLVTGDHELLLVYYEHLGDARVQLSWEYVPSPPAPTATFTSTPTLTPTLTPTSTATLTATATVPLPTDTSVPPTPTTVSINPLLTLDPQAGPIGVPFNVLGSGWPPNLPVDLFLIRPTLQPGPAAPVMQITSDGAGNFTVQLLLSPGQGWEGLLSARILAQSADKEYRAEAVYRLLPPLSRVRSTPIPVTEERFALPEPAYLVLDSDAAWAEWFGAEQPPAQPPVDWEREIVLGAFLGRQPAELPVEMVSIVQREDTVSAWLSAVVPTQTIPFEGEAKVPRVMVRVSRAALSSAGQEPPAGLVFAFLDATGRLLAQGPAGDLKPPPAISAVQANVVQAQARVAATVPESAPLVAAAPVLTTTVPLPVATPPLAGAAPGAATVEAAVAQPSLDQAAATAAMAGEPATPGPTSEVSPEPTPAAPGQPSSVWVAVGAAAFLLAGWGIAVAVNHRVNRRR